MIIFDYPQSQCSLNQKDVLRKISKSCVNILEIGCWLGESSYIFAESVKRNGGSLIVVDWFNGNVDTPLAEDAKNKNIYDIFLNNMAELGVLDCITTVVGPSSEAHSHIKDSSFDLVYIDADHRYSGITSDIKNYMPKLKTGGVISGHDYDSIEYDNRYIEQDCINGVHHGVIKAVREMFNEYEVEKSIWRAYKK